MHYICQYLPSYGSFKSPYAVSKTLVGMLFACLKWCFFDSPCNWGRAPRWETPAECVLVVVRILKHLSGTSSCNYNQLYVCFAVCFHVFHWYFVLSPWVGSPDYVRGPTSMCTGVGNCWDLRSWTSLKHGFLISIHLKHLKTPRYYWWKKSG